MSLGYADGYYLRSTRSTADNVNGIDTKQAAVVYSITICASQNDVSGRVSLVDGSSTADANPTRFAAVMESGGSITRTFDRIHTTFPAGLSFDTGLIVSALNVTADISLTYMKRN